MSSGNSVPVGPTLWGGPPPPRWTSVPFRCSDHQGKAASRPFTSRKARSRSACPRLGAGDGAWASRIRGPPTSAVPGEAPGSKTPADGPPGQTVCGSSGPPIIEIASASSPRACAPATKRSHSAAPSFHMLLGSIAATAPLLSSPSQRGVMCSSSHATGSLVRAGRSRCQREPGGGPSLFSSSSHQCGGR
jgi:hypothetical protein